MPLTKKGEKILNAMKKKYGVKEGEAIFYASTNKGTITGTEHPADRKDERIKNHR